MKIREVIRMIEEMDGRSSPRAAATARINMRRNPDV
jgi:hypothetical protein